MSFAQSVKKNTSVSDEAKHLISVTIPEVSLINVVGTTPNFAFQAPTEAGEKMQTELVDSSYWINYSFVKSAKHHASNNVYVRFEQNQLPNGLRLEISALPYTGIGRGNHGVTAGRVEVTQNQHVLIKNIATCYTGTGLRNGHQLIYHLSVDQDKYSQLYAQQVNLNVLYTIAE